VFVWKQNYILVDEYFFFCCTWIVNSANKVVFTHKPYLELTSAVYIQGFEQQQKIGDLFEYCGLNRKRFYDQFDYVGWFNQHKQN
ncbi:DUF1919 domain-containing protein, partial [Glaesserella parasuis]|nr:DUF1919 domain-containing protein [Glaesserella parasuis]